MSTAVAAIAILLLMQTLLAACSGTFSSDHDPDIVIVDATPVTLDRTPAERVEQADGSVVITAAPVGARPEPRGTLRLAGPAVLPSTLDPALIQDNTSAFLARQVWRGLLRLDTEMNVQPELAERIEISADSQTYTFTLRPGIAFQDGTPITADAVADSFARACDAERLGRSAETLACGIYLTDIVGADAVLNGDAEQIDGIEVQSPTKLRMTLRRPAVSFLQKLTGSPALIVDTRETADADWWQNANGSGPFALSQFSNSGIRLTAAAAYAPGRAVVAEVVLSTGSEAANALNAFEAGELDVVDLPTYAIDRARTPGDPLHAGLRETPQLTTSFMLINPTLAPWDDVRVREAVLRAFEREQVANSLLDGSVQVASSMVPPGILGREWSVNLPTFDPDAARALMEEAGTPEVPPALYDSGVASAIAESTSEHLGIEVQAVQVEWPTYIEMMDERSLPAFILTWIADYPDPENFLTSMLHSASPDNVSGYANPEVDALLDEAAVETDPEERARLFSEAEQVAADDYVLLPLYVDVAYTVVQPWVTGWDLSPSGVLTLDDVQVLVER